MLTLVKVVLLKEEGGPGLRLGHQLVVPVLAHVAAVVADDQVEHADQSGGLVR